MTLIKHLGDVAGGDVEQVGGKGANLIQLVQAGMPVPPGFIVTTDAYTAFVEAGGFREQILQLAKLPPGAPPKEYVVAADKIRELFTATPIPDSVAKQIHAAYGQLGAGRATAVAVRSSATAEDSAAASFAGQQDTYLNVVGITELERAVVQCWASLWTARAMAYRSHGLIPPEELSLAVIVQKMIESDASGVMFSANPATGRRDEVLISAAWGLGESVVAGTVTPDDIVVDPVAGTVVSRRTADKTVMTVSAQVGTQQVPVQAQRRFEPVLNDDQAVTLAQYARQIADHFGSPQDIEWAQAGWAFYILQSRPITALPEPSAETPSEWPVPYPKGLYFRASIVEQLPDPLSPLFADLIDGSVKRSLTQLMQQSFGRMVLGSGDIGLPTINGYAYYYYRSSLLWRATARSITVLYGMARGDNLMGIRGWQEHSRPQYVREVARWSAKPVEEMSGQELRDGVVALLDAGTRYYTAVQSVIPVATWSELLFRAFYNRVVRRNQDPPAEDFLLGFESEPIRAELSLYDLGVWTRQWPVLVKALERVTPEEFARWLREEDTPPGVEDDVWRDWLAWFHRHLDRFGHTTYNLDFHSPVPADTPELLLGPLQFHVRDRGHNPRERQRRSAAHRDTRAAYIVGRLGPLRRRLFERLLRWAQTSAPLREDALSDIGLAWPQMRRMLHELGQRLVRSGVIADPADVFWLRNTELTTAVEWGLADSGVPAAPSGGQMVVLVGAEQPVRAAAIEERKMVWRGQRKATAPQLLPDMPWLNRAFGSMMPARSQEPSGETIAGVGASGGRVRGAARVIAGPEQFALMQPGDVLVARMTTPAWTSLFSMASAIVTDVGGPLSHSSIVAREYGIPAVLGTGVATQVLTSDDVVTVDGDAGTVVVESSHHNS